MVERSLSMREVRGSIPCISIAIYLLHSIQRLFLSKAKKPSLAYPMAMTDKVRITPVRVG